jgi:hypothetical protein
MRVRAMKALGRGKEEIEVRGVLAVSVFKGE